MALQLVTMSSSSTHPPQTTDAGRESTTCQLPVVDAFVKFVHLVEDWVLGNRRLQSFDASSAARGQDITDCLQLRLHLTQHHPEGLTALKDAAVAQRLASIGRTEDKGACAGIRQPDEAPLFAAVEICVD